MRSVKGPLGSKIDTASSASDGGKGVGRIDGYEFVGNVTAGTQTEVDFTSVNDWWMAIRAQYDFLQACANLL